MHLVLERNSVFLSGLGQQYFLAQTVCVADLFLLQEVILPVTCVLFDDEQKVLSMLRSPGCGYFSDSVIRFSNVLVEDRRLDIFACQVGASKFVNSYHGARRGPNAALRVTTARGPNSGSIELVVRTANCVGVASKSEILISYGATFDLSRPVAEDPDKRFKGSLETLFKKHAESAGLSAPSTSTATPSFLG